MLLCTQIFQRDFAPLAEFLEDNTIVNALSCTVNLKFRSGTMYSISGSCLHISGPETGQIGLYLLIEEEFIQKRRQRSSGRFGGQNLVNYLLRQDV